MFLYDRFRPITDTVGLFNRSVGECASEYTAWMQPNLGSDSSLQTVVYQSGTLEEHLWRLCPLVRVGITRTLFVAVGRGWTACFTNGWRGTDMSSIVPMLAVRLGCSALRVTCRPDLGIEQQRRFGARIVEVHRSEQKPARVISVINDGGKWVEFVGGVPLIEEDAMWFAPRRIRDRFSAAQLQELVGRLVPDIWKVGKRSFETAAIVERIGVLPAVITTVDLDEVQRTIPALIEQ